MSPCRQLLSLATGLMVGAFAAGAAEARVVALPPFLVEETAKSLPWRYAEVASLEVLSCCPERLTRELIANHHRLHALLGELLPPALQLGPQKGSCQESGQSVFERKDRASRVAGAGAVQIDLYRFLT